MAVSFLCYYSMVFTWRCSIMAECVELLFFDTFSHESCEEINLDLVQFPKPVIVNELRIIPLGARVQADFPGGVRLGATNPSQFKIEFFVNDLSKAPGAAAFENLGTIEYNQNGNIRMEITHRPIPTDGLVLRGWYSTITLAVYGCLTKTIQEQIASNQSVLPPSTITNDPRIPPNESLTTSATAEWVQQHAQVGAPVEHNYLVEGEDFEGKYPNPTPSHYPYQEEWSSSIPTMVGSHNDSYSSNKKEAAYENSQMDWNEEKMFWDHDKDKEVRHRDRRSPSLEYNRDHSSDYRERTSVDGRHSDREYFNKSSSLHHHNSWVDWDSSSGRKRPRSPPIHPRTPPQDDTNSGSVKKDCNSPSGVTFETFSAGDVESISDGEISESEVIETPAEKVPDEVPEVNTPVASPQSPPRPEVEHEQSIDDTEQFEPILSDEDIPDEMETQDIDYDFSEFSDNPIKTFNPYTFITQPLSYLSDPSMSDYEWKVSHLCSEEYLKYKKVPEAIQLEEIFNNCDDFSGNNEELWVIGIEKLLPLIMKGLPYVGKKEGIIDTLISWIDVGLNYEDALTQPQPGLIIRHIKAGLRLAETLCNCSEQITLDLIERINLHRKLIDLYHIQYMALSIKLMILRTLDSSLRYKSCVELFLNSVIFSIDDDSENVNGYVKIVDMMQQDQLARVKFALASLLRKFHIYEILSELSQVIYNYDRKLKSKDSDSNEEINVSLISICLEEIIKYYKNAPTMITHPKRFLPVHSQFDFGPTFSNTNPLAALFTFFKSHSLLETILIILNSPEMSSDWSLLLLIQEFISALIETPEGLRFLCASIDTINQIVKILIGSTTSTSIDENEVVTIGINIQLGLVLVYRLQALNYVDVLCNFWEYQSLMKLDPDSAEIVDILHNLYCLTFNPIGKSAVIFILTRCDYVQSILKFLKLGSKTEDMVNNKKSPSRLYVIDLVTLIVKFSDYMPFLQKYGAELYDIVVKDLQQNESQDLVPWLKPVQNQSLFHYDDISEICEIIKRNIDNCTALPGELVTVLRILRYLGVQNCDKDLQQASDVFNEDYIESKYKYVILQLFSYDGVSHLTSILQKFVEYYDEPYLHSHKFLGRDGLLLLSVISPCVQLLRRMLIFVIQCRNTDFKDLTAIPVLLSTYNLMCFVPSSSHAFYKAQKVRKDIIETLLAYTLPISNEMSTESEALNKSLWTLMIIEVIKFITTSPQIFLNGLLILSELLPLPLPIQTKEPLTDDEINRVVNYRKLWSAHLHSLNQLLQELIVTLCESSYQPLLHVLRKICIQLSDLAAPTALIVVRSVLDALLSSMLSNNQTSIPVSCRTSRLLNFLACLLAYPSIKAAFLHLITNNTSATKTDEKYLSSMDALCLIISSPFDDVNHLQAQDCVISIFQSLCCIDISLLPRFNDTSSLANVELYLSNSLPMKQILVQMCLALLDHISVKEHSFNTILQVLRIFLALAEHDFGMFHLKNCLEKKNKAVYNLLTKLHDAWNKNSMECLTTLMTTLELLKELSTPTNDLKTEHEEGCGLPPLGHSISLSVEELVEICQFKKQPVIQKMEEDEEAKDDNVKETHPLYLINAKLKESNAEVENYPSLVASLSELLKLMEENELKSVEKKESIPEPVLPHPEPILVQFTLRPVYIMLDVIEDDRLTAAYWLSPPTVSEEHDQEMEQIPCDILEFVKTCLPKMNFLEDLENLCKLKVTPGDIEQSHSLKKRAKEKVLSGSASVTSSSTTPTNSAAESKTKKPFVTPMRGRGLPSTTRVLTPQQQRGDLFRTRMPNTSRPPSLHVDDFVALETCGQQPTGPTGYNKISMRAAQDLRARGRGRAFGLDRGARFFGALSFRPRGWHLMPHSEGSGGQPPLPHSFRGNHDHLRPPFVRGVRPPINWEPRPFPIPGMRGVISRHGDSRLIRPFPR